MYQSMGAHPDEVDGISGTRFAVWAPNAQEVCIVCDKNHWKHGEFYLNSSDAGVWSGFMPGVSNGDAYKYSLRGQNGEYFEKSDPYAFYSELRPKTASIVYDLENFPWQDDQCRSRNTRLMAPGVIRPPVTLHQPAASVAPMI